MEKSTRRLFVGNITSETNEGDLKKAFSRYGQIENIELKRKNNLVDPENPTHFAFVTILTDEFSLNKCLNRFSEKDLNGLFLNVSIAKENFLDKLKKEREEANSNIKSSSFTKENGYNKTGFGGNKRSFQTNNSKKRKTFDSDDEVFQEDMNEQRSLKHELLNETETNEAVPANDNEKRIQSLKKMHESYTHKKMIIQQSLSGLDTINSKKIKFDFYESEEEEPQKVSHKNLNLFENEGDSDEENENIFKDSKKKMKRVFDEKKSKMKTNVNADPRFKTDENFFDGEEEESKSSSETENKSENNEKEEEKETQIRIMEEIVGHKLTRPVDPNRKKFPQTVMRYDPKNEEHQEIINSMNKTKNRNNLDLKKNKLKTVDLEKNKGKETEIEVSKDQFYTINDDLKSSLKRRGDGFSLLSMFGNQEEENEKTINATEEKILIKSSKKHILDVQNNPFKFDSSESEDDLQTKEIEPETTSNGQKKKKIENGKTVKSGVWVENFFIFEGDKRLKEGTEFFKCKKQKISDDNEEKEDYSKVKEQLRQIINKKIIKSKKSMEGKHKFKAKGKLRIKK